MQIKRRDITPTKISLEITAEQSELTKLHNHVLGHFQAKTKVAGFRPGKAPLSVVEKHVDQSALQAEFVDEAINSLYRQAISQQSSRVVSAPEVTLKKFVPFTSLEFTAEVEVLGPVKLGDYKKIKKSLAKVNVVAKDINAVIADLQQRSADKQAVKRAIKKGDEAIIDFKGIDSKNQPIKGAEGSDYPLLIGSQSFIHGFEDNLIGLKAGDEKSFTLTFPKDYAVKALANKKVTFNVVVKTVNQITEPAADDAFAAKLGPFKTLEDLKSDIKQQLLNEKQQTAQRQLENDIIGEVVDKSSLDLPDSMIEEQIERLKTEVRQNLAYRGQTWQEMLDSVNKTEQQYIDEELKPEAERRVKTGLVLAEISVSEKLDVSPDELEERLVSLRQQYTDSAMRAELEKPAARQDIASRILTEKTVQRLVKLATDK